MAVEKDYCQLSFNYASPSGEGGFPGRLEITVLYTLYNDNSLEITYKAQSTKKTAVSLTNHSYFNLSGQRQKVNDHKLLVGSSKFLHLGKDLLPTGQVLDLQNYGVKAMQFYKISEMIQALQKVSPFLGIDHPFLVKKDSKDLALAAQYYHPTSGRQLSIYTDSPFVQIYSGNFFRRKHSSC